MKEERDMDAILSNLRIKPDEAAKQAAWNRMLAHRAKLTPEDTGAVRGSLGNMIKRGVLKLKDTVTKGENIMRELSMDELAMAAGGVQPDCCQFKDAGKPVREAPDGSLLKMCANCEMNTCLSCKCSAGFCENGWHKVAYSGDTICG